jgi:peptidoglycan/xylan/chitin deacetylase (PgdA/CDA1 family)
LVNVQKEIINLFMQKQIPLTLGIIGNNIGTDNNLINYIQNAKSTYGDLVEFANHGGTADITSLSREEQLTLITNSNNQILNVLKYKPQVFMPPFGQYDNDTVYAMQRQSMHYLSSISSSDLPPYSFDSPSLLRFPATTATGYIESGRAVYGKLANQTIADVGYSLRDYGFAVVLLHPSEYSERKGWSFNDNLYLPQYSELNTLIDDIHKKGLKIVLVSKIDDNVTTSKTSVPQWFKNTALFWSQDKINNQEFFNSVKYLLKERIILTSTLSTQMTSMPDQSNISWLKNNAGLWATNKITTNEFIEGIRFLIK